jgi:hypothetical protein
MSGLDKEEVVDDSQIFLDPIQKQKNTETDHNERRRQPHMSRKGSFIWFDSKHVDAMITSLKYTTHSQHVYVGSIKKCHQENS